jgi:hypothetical protein
MAALDTRARVTDSGDFYLMPLPNTGQTAKLMPSWIQAALDQPDLLQEIYRPAQPDSSDPPELLARAYELTRAMQAEVDGRQVAWDERVQIVQSASLLDSQKGRLEKDLQQAERELPALTASGKGRRVWREESELRGAVETLLQEHDVDGLLEVSLQAQHSERRRHSGRGRPGKDAVVVVEVETRWVISEVRRQEQEIAQRHRRMGWRARVSNAQEQRLTVEGSVLLYREGGGQERVFHQLKDKPLGIRPLFVRKDEQIVGLTRLLVVALRVLAMVEVVVRAELEQTGEKLQRLYEGQASREESKPTANRLLGAIARLGLSLTQLSIDGEVQWALGRLPDLLVQVLGLLGLPVTLYTDLVSPDDSDQPPTQPAPLPDSG